MLSFCGLDCETCQVRLATLEKDLLQKRAMREMIAAEITRIYGKQMDPRDVTDCDGCREKNGRLLTGCSDCEIRKCAGLRGVENCAHCSDYACDAIKRHFVYDPASQERLEKTRLP